VAVAVGHGDDQGQLAAVLEIIGGQFVEAVTIDPALAVAVPTPKGQGVVIGPVAVAAIFWFLAPVVAVAQLLAVRIGPGGELGPVASGVEVVQVDELQVHRAGDEAGVEERLQGLLPDGQGGEVAVLLQDGGQRGRLERASQNTVSQTVDDVLVKPQVVLVLVLVGLVPLVAAPIGPASGCAGLARALQQAVLEVIEGAYARDVFGMKAADERVEGVVVHHLDPDVEADDATLHHSQTRAEHAHGMAGDASLVG